jgi:hypothetical protein
VVEDNPEASLELMRSMQSELAALRNAFNIEVARSDFLWDRALARHMVTPEEYALVHDPPAEPR